MLFKAKELDQITKGVSVDQKKKGPRLKSWSSSTERDQADEEKPVSLENISQLGKGKSTRMVPGNKEEKVFQERGSDLFC